MSNYTTDLENQLNRIGKDIRTFVERLVPVESGDFDFSPDCDILESDEGFKIITDLPGMESDDIRITLKNRVLAISGEREFTPEEGDVLKREERKQGVFSRSFAIPVEATSSDVKAKFKNGVLTVFIPKAENEEKAHRITIE